MPVKRRAVTTRSIEPHSDTPNTTRILYILLLICTFLLGYLLSRVQTQEGFAAKAPAGAAPVAGQPNQPAAAPQGKVKVENGHFPVLGKDSAKVTIVEFSDFQCPFCRSFFTQAYKDIKRDYIDTGKAKMYFRHYPLSFHPAAQISAEAAECANDQDKFWEFHDKLYEEQEKQGSGTTITYTVDDIKRWAQDMGLDANKFNTCVDSGTHKDKVAKDQADGTAAGVSGTPSFYVNGTQLVGAQPFSAFKAAIDAEL